MSLIEDLNWRHAVKAYDPTKKVSEKLVPSALNPDCMRDCSHVIIFAAWDRYTAERIDHVYDMTTEERGLPKGRFNSYTDMLKKVYLDQPAELNFAHTARQTYIALGLALAQAAELRVDTTPAEGFNQKIVDEVLELEKYGLKSVSLMYVGYANQEKDWLATMKKVRVPREEFVLEF